MSIGLLCHKKGKNKEQMTKAWQCEISYNTTCRVLFNNICKHSWKIELKDKVLLREFPEDISDSLGLIANISYLKLFDSCLSLGIWDF